MRTKIGCKSIEHQGWKAYKLWMLTKYHPNLIRIPQIHNPYPRGSSAERAFNLGYSYAAEGKTWDGRLPASQSEEGEPDRTDRRYGF